MTIQFWSNEPTILLNKNYIFELWPTSNMCYEQKLNAITRLIIFLTILGYILTMSERIPAVGVVTLLLIFVLFTFRKGKQKQKITRDMIENFEVNTNSPIKDSTFINPVTLDAVLKSEFKEGNKKNPFSNVLLTQIEDEPERKAAPPAFNVEVDEDITKNVKRAVQMMNPGIKNTNKQLFGDLWQQFQLDNSLRAFNSTPNTRVTNDATSYAKFLYGDMPSAKESTPEGNMQRYKDSYRHTLY
jgi:hypothetical protein